MYFLKREPRIDFLGRRGLAGIVSAVLIVIGIVSLGVRGLAFGIDFTGGTLVEVSYEETVEASSVRDLIAKAGFESALVQYFGTSKDILVRLPASAVEDAAQVSSRIMVALRSPYKETLVTSASGDLQQCLSYGGASGRCVVQMRRVEFVGPQVGEELTQKGGLAMLYALLGILIYVSWRFEWRFAIGAVAALVHDVLITVGVFSVLGLEFSLPVLAAILAVIGYSLNDTIVVFDRVRENFRKMRRGTPIEIMNVSVNQTLSRTLLTSLTITRGLDFADHRWGSH